MAEKKFDNNNSGVLYKNAKKTEPRQPEYRGHAEVNGVRYWVSSWIKEARQGEYAGSKFMTLKFEEKEEEDQAPPASDKKTTTKMASADEDVPF